MDDTFVLVLLTVFCAAGVIQLFYYLWFYLTPAIYKPAPETEQTPPVSVIICARNEASNLDNFLPSVLGQDYPGFEVIVVNDCSEDNTDEILGKYLQLYPNLRVSSVNKDTRFTHNKKFAQFIGIKAARHDILLFTDADCRPVSDRWIRQMVSGFGQDTEFVLGYGGYSSDSDILNSYIRYETLFIAMQYLGMAIRGIPYMGVGRNLAYRKEVFFRNKGFGAHNHVVSGDDDLFVNGNANRGNTKVEIRPGSHTVSVPAGNTASWVKQKTRHLSTAKYYKTADKLLLAGEPLSRIVFFTLFIILMVLGLNWPYIIGIFALRLIAVITVTGLNQKILNEKKLVLISVIFDIFSPLINLALYLGTLKGGDHKIKWK